MVTKLEQNQALKLTSAKYIPAHIAQTQLGLDAMNPDKAAPAFVVKPVDLARPPSRSGSYQRSGSRVLKHHCRADISYMFFHLVNSEKTKIYFNF